MRAPPACVASGGGSGHPRPGIHPEFLIKGHSRASNVPAGRVQNRSTRKQATLVEARDTVFSFEGRTLRESCVSAARRICQPIALFTSGAQATHEITPSNRVPIGF